MSFYTMLVDNMDWDSRFEKSFKWTWYVNDESRCRENPGAAVGDTALYTPPFPVSAAQREWAKGKYRIEDINDYFNPNSPNGEETSGPREMFAQLAKWLDPTRVDVGLMTSLDKYKLDSISPGEGLSGVQVNGSSLADVDMQLRWKF